MTFIGITSTLLHRDIAKIHRAEVVLTRDDKAPERWGRADVFCLRNAGRKHLEGMVLIWGPDADALVGQLKIREPVAPTVLLVSAQQVPDDHRIRELADRLRTGDRVPHLLVVPPDRALWQIRIDAAGLLSGLPSQGQEQTEAPEPRSEAPRLARPAPAVVTPGTLPAFVARPDPQEIIALIIELIAAVADGKVTTAEVAKLLDDARVVLARDLDIGDVLRVIGDALHRDAAELKARAEELEAKGKSKHAGKLRAKAAERE